MSNLKRVVIERADYFGSLLEDYPCLKKYENDYISEDDDSDKYWKYNCIVTEMTEEEFWALVKELIEIEDVVIGSGRIYDRYGITH